MKWSPIGVEALANVSIEREEVAPVHDDLDTAE